MKLFIIEEPILKYKLVFNKNDFKTLKYLSKNIDNSFNPVVKSFETKKLLYWMYKNALLILR